MTWLDLVSMKSPPKHGHLAHVLESRPQMPALLEEYIPLRRAVALCCNEDVEEGFDSINRAVNGARDALRGKLRRKSVWQSVSLSLGLITLGAIVADIVGPLHQPPVVFAIEIIAVVQIFFTLFAWHVWQYGFGFIAAPRPLPHDADKRIEAALAQLQKESGPQVYRLSDSDARYRPLDRRLFFGRLRYLVLSENPADRSHVHSFRAPFPLSGDLYVTRSDAQRLLAASKPKRKGGPGRDPKYAYFDAGIAIMMDPEIISLDLSDRGSALHNIEHRMLAWFEEHAPESGDIPRADLVRPYALRIFDQIAEKNLNNKTR